MVILKISSKNEQNVVVSLEDGSVLFLSKDLVYEKGLRKGDDIPDDLRLELIEENQKYFIKKKSFDYLTRRLHSTQELRTKLLQKKYEKRLIELVLEELTEKKYLNDEEFAEKYIAEAAYFKRSGKQKIKSELLKKGISLKIIDEQLLNVFNEEESFENAIEIGKKKIKVFQNRGYDEKQVRLKLFGYLISKGYEFEAVKKVCHELLTNSSFED